MKISELVSALVLIGGVKIDEKTQHELTCEVGRLQAESSRLSGASIIASAKLADITTIDDTSVKKMTAASLVLRGLTGKVSASSVGIGEYLLERCPAFQQWVKNAAVRVIAAEKREQDANKS